MATSTKADQDLAVLKSTVSTISTLISQLQGTSATTDSTTNPKNGNVNALELAHDTASLIKAHSTKLSLLIINKPFTATAISTVLRELISGPLSGLASAVEICDGAKYTNAMASELKHRANKLYTHLETFMKAIPLDGKILSDDQKNGTGQEKGHGSLANTGIVWQACESVMELKTLGVAGLAIKKAEEYRDLLKDALEELQEWGEEESDGEDRDVEPDEDDGSVNEEEEISAQDAIDNLFSSQRHIPTDDTEKIRPRLETSQKKLKLAALMYQAVIKRRFKTLPCLHFLALPEESTEKDGKGPDAISTVDEVLQLMKEIPDITDELASAFYELDPAEIDKQTEQCCQKGVAIVELLLKNWTGQDDEFTSWVRFFDGSCLSYTNDCRPINVDQPYKPRSHNPQNVLNIFDV